MKAVIRAARLEGAKEVVVKVGQASVVIPLREAEGRDAECAETTP
jgi:hypothetical protein